MLSLANRHRYPPLASQPHFVCGREIARRIGENNALRCMGTKARPYWASRCSRSSPRARVPRFAEPQNAGTMMCLFLMRRVASDDDDSSSDLQTTHANATLMSLTCVSAIGSRHSAMPNRHRVFSPDHCMQARHFIALK